MRYCFSSMAGNQARTSSLPTHTHAQFSAYKSPRCISGKGQSATRNLSFIAHLFVCLFFCYDLNYIVSQQPHHHACSQSKDSTSKFGLCSIEILQVTDIKIWWAFEKKNQRSKSLFACMEWCSPLCSYPMHIRRGSRLEGFNTSPNYHSMINKRWIVESHRLYTMHNRLLMVNMKLQGYNPRWVDVDDRVTRCLRTLVAYWMQMMQTNCWKTSQRDQRRLSRCP